MPHIATIWQNKNVPWNWVALYAHSNKGWKNRFIHYYKSNIHREIGINLPGLRIWIDHHFLGHREREQ